MGKYRLKNTSKVNPEAVAGTIVYDQRGPDYGLSRDDERMLGYRCQTVTLNENGDYPGFVVPAHDLERIDDAEGNPAVGLFGGKAFRAIGYMEGALTDIERICQRSYRNKAELEGAMTAALSLAQAALRKAASV